MLEQSVLDLNGAYPHAFYLHHVVGAAHIPVIAVSVSVVFVSGAQPVALNGLFRLFMLVPVARADRIALDEQIAGFAFWNWLSVFVDDAGLITIKHLPARSRPRRARTIGNEHV